METRKNLLQTLGDWWAERQSQPADPSTGTSARSGRAAPLLRWLTPNGGTIILILLLVFTQNIWARPALETAGTPGPSGKTVNYQGRLADSGGNPKNGNFAMTFALYNAATAGTLVWGPESHPSVTVSNGLFSVGLGSQTSGGIPTTVWNGDIYLQVTVGGETLTPRELIRSVPIAGMALTVPDGSVTSEKLSRHIHKATLTSDVQMPNANTRYDILSLNINLERETLITIQASVGCANNTTDTFFRNGVVVDGTEITISDQWNKLGIGEQSMMSTSLLLGPGQHQIKLHAHSWANNSFITGDARTQLIVVEG